MIVSSSAAFWDCAFLLCWRLCLLLLVVRLSLGILGAGFGYRSWWGIFFVGSGCGGVEIEERRGVKAVEVSWLKVVDFYIVSIFYGSVAKVEVVGVS